MGKYAPPDVQKPVATLTAWRGVLVNPATGQPFGEKERRRLIDSANRNLKANIRNRDLSYFPVVGAGQETDEAGNITYNKENSFIVQPVSDMDDQTFIAHIQALLFNPTDEVGAGPFTHTQYSGLVKLPGDSQAYELKSPNGVNPHNPARLFGVVTDR